MTDNEPELVTQAPSLAKAEWCGEEDILPRGAMVDVLAVDPAARISRRLFREHGIISGVPARAACWIRWWPEAWDHASYRSCDLADLDLSDADFDRLASTQPLTEQLAERGAEIERLREALKDFANMPCETRGAEDAEPGCCRTCRARAALTEKEG